MNELITCDDVCSRLKLKKQSVYNMIHRGEFILNKHYFKPTKRILLFDWDALKDWLRGTKAKGNSTSNRIPGNSRHGEPRKIKNQSRCLINI